MTGPAYDPGSQRLRQDEGQGDGEEEDEEQRDQGIWKIAHKSVEIARN